jgi:hypothetical protein
MGEWLHFVQCQGRAWVAALLVMHGVLAAFAPCPYRPNLVVNTAAAATSDPHAHHAAPPADQTSDGACPFELLHALYGLFRPAPLPTLRATLSAPLTLKVAGDPSGISWLLTTRIDPPPRIV